MRISDWSSDVCASDLLRGRSVASLGPGAALGGGEREAIEAFKRDVIDPSMDALVILDFWAEWCGPCKALAPVLEKVTAEFAPRVKLAKINVDENRTIAAQFRVQSIPTVYAIFQGQPVYDLTPEIGRASCRERVCQYV